MKNTNIKISIIFAIISLILFIIGVINTHDSDLIMSLSLVFLCAFVERYENGVCPYIHKPRRKGSNKVA